MDQDLQKYYDDYFTLFQADGWKQLMDEYGESLKILQENADYDCKTNDEWQEHRGMIKQLRNLLGFEAYIKSSYERITDDSV